MNGERWLRIYPKQLKRIDDPSLLFVLKKSRKLHCIPLRLCEREIMNRATSDKTISIPLTSSITLKNAARS